jgi:hypothetical protein
MAVLAGRRTRQLVDAAEHFGVRRLAAAFTLQATPRVCLSLADVVADLQV